MGPFGEDMRVLQVVPTLNPATGGPARSVPLLCRGLAHAGVEVVLYTTNAGPEDGGGLPDSGEVEDEGFRIRFFPMKWRGHTSVSRPFLRAVKADARNFDLVHVHSIWNPTATFSMRAARRAGAPYGVTPRGMLDPVVLARHRCRKKVYGWLWERRNVESAAFVHFTAAAEEEKARLSGWRFPASFVVPNAIDVSQWDDLPPRSEFERMFPETAGRPIVLFAGRINWVKNLPVLLRAFAVATNREACLALAGPDTEGLGQELRRLARELGIEERVVFTGMLDCRALRAAYAAADVFVLPSQKESFGISAAEAMASSVPVVLSSGVDIARDVADAGAGLVADSPEEIAEAVRGLLREDDDRRRMGMLGANLAREQWSWERTGRAMVEAYRVALHEGGTGHGQGAHVRRRGE